MLKIITKNIRIVALSLLPTVLGTCFAPLWFSASAAEPKIALSLRDVEIAEAMEMLSRQQRVNIVLSKGVNGKISVNLYDTTLTDAIRAISNAAGYEAEKRGSSYFVMSRDDVGSYVDNGTTQVKTYQLNYSKASEVKNILEGHISNYGTISELKDRNMLIVEDTPEFLKRITGLVKQLDYQPRQIVIEARILEVTLSDSEAYGIEWSKVFSTKGAEGLIGRGVPSNNFSGLFLQIIDDDLELFLDMLQREGRTRTLSTPKLLTVENKKASVIVGDRLGYVNTVTINQVTTENTEFLESGVILEVTPMVDEFGRISLEVHPEVSTGTVTDGIPSQTTTSVNTNLLVPNGATSFIGGLIKTQIFKDRTGVPVISKIPVFGKLFTRKENRKINTEIIVMITPTIVDPGEPDWQKSERNRIGDFEKEYNVGELQSPGGATASNF